MTDQLVQYRESYDLVLLDGGSLTESPLLDHIAFWRDAKSDGVILILNTKNQTEVNAKHIAQRLRQHHISLLGIAENYV
jgi:Mrp family chromosome partitioning ATPase